MTPASTTTTTDTVPAALAPGNPAPVNIVPPAAVVPVPVPPLMATANGGPADLQSYIYDAGFVHAAWADTLLEIDTPGAPEPRQAFRLHALFLSRSPVLYQLLTAGSVVVDSEGGFPLRCIALRTTDANLGPVGCSMVIATLYGRSLDLRWAGVEVVRSVIACGALLGLDGVARAGVKFLLSSVVSNATGGLDHLEQVLQFALSGGSSSATEINDKKHDETNDNKTHNNNESIDIDYPGPYPLYTKGFLKYVVDFLVTSVDAGPQLNDLIYALPYAIVKYVCEHAGLRVGPGGHLARHKFVGLVAATRRKKVDDGYEENAIIAFDNGKSRVVLVRKPIKKKKIV
ncbi:hypothetical protein D0Z00_000145 [Geotrichum galactomycetum]|uniref:Uncharacterized protein n=1 Tax=Geotrichum galactomycetum TaxID=27317 RepID=A0ACB6VAK0_9ASCO|nr:hypothetical protein D0Z00_000145 [Geotrichum candidum]